MNGGELGNRKSINVPGTHINLPALKDKDIQDLKDGCKGDFDYIAASFIRSADDVLAIRKVLDENGGKDIKIISKIESQEGIDNFQSILEVSDGIMVALVVVTAMLFSLRSIEKVEIVKELKTGSM